MGSTNLYKRKSSIFGSDINDHGFNHKFVSVLDDIGGEIVKMLETKLALFILTIVGIPAGIYAWFIDIQTTYDLWKSIVLGSIFVFTSTVIGLRYFIKLLTEFKEFKEKYYSKKK